MKTDPLRKYRSMGTYTKEKPFMIPWNPYARRAFYELDDKELEKAGIYCGTSGQHLIHRFSEKIR